MRVLASHVAVLTVAAFVGPAITANAQRPDSATFGVHGSVARSSAHTPSGTPLVAPYSLIPVVPAREQRFALSTREILPAPSRSARWSAGRGAKWGFVVGALAIDAVVIGDGSASISHLFYAGTGAGVVGAGIGAIVGGIVGLRQSQPVLVGGAAAGDSQLGVLAPGRRIRVSASVPPLRRRPATIDRVAGDSIVVREDGQAGLVTVPLASLRRLELSRGPGSRVERAVLDGALGGLIGAVALGGVGFLSERRSCRTGSDVCGLATAAGVVVGGGVGIVVGAAIGASKPAERWEKVPLPVRVGITRFDHHPAITLSAAF